MAMTRKTFLLRLMGGGWVLAGAGCGGGGDAPATGGGAASGCTASISDNHGHEIVIGAADLNSTADRTFDIRGSADHTHSVTFTAAQLAQLKAGGSVSVRSSATFGHDHTIGERCV